MEQLQQARPNRYSFDTISIWALIATIIVAALIIIPFGSIPFIETKAFVLGAGAIIALAGYVLARLTRGNIIFPSSLLLPALWLPVVAYALAALFSKSSFASSFWGTGFEPDTLGFMLTATVLGTLAALVVRRAEQYKGVLKAFACAFGAMVSLQLLVVIVGQFAPQIVSPGLSLLGSNNDIAALLGLGVISILLTLRVFDLSQKLRRFIIAAGAGALILLALENISLVWSLLAITSLGIFVEAIMHRGGSAADAELDEAVALDEQPLPEQEHTGNRSVALPLVVLAISLFFLVGGTLGGALSQASHVGTLDLRPSWQGTFDVAKQVYTSSPFFGSGPSTFGMEWLKSRNVGLNTTAFWNIDFTSGIGFIPTSLVTTGLVGVIAWLGLIGMFLWSGFRLLMRRTPENPFIRFVALLTFVSAAYLFAFAIFDLPGTVLLALLFVFVGLLASLTRFATNGSQLGVSFARAPRLGFVIVFSLTLLLLASVVGAYALMEHYVASVLVTQAAAAYSAGNLDAADRTAQSAAAFVPSSAAYQIQASVAKARLDAIAASTTIDRAAAQQAYQSALSQGINAALTATNIDPSNYQNWLALGSLYAQAVPLNVSGAYDSAKTAYDKAQVLNPTNPQIPYVIAQLDLAHKDLKAAQDDLKAAISLKQDYTAAILLLSQLEVQSGNIKDALDAALAAAYFTPNDPNILFQIGVLYAGQGDLTNAAAALAAAVKVNPQFANARYILAAVYAKQGNFKDALSEVQAIAAMSEANAKAVATQITALEAGKNPFPKNLLTISPTPSK